MTAEEIYFESKLQKTKIAMLSFSKELALISSLCICLGSAHIYTFFNRYNSHQAVRGPSVDGAWIHGKSERFLLPVFPIVKGNLSFGCVICYIARVSARLKRGF